jgi:Phosphatase
MTSSAAWRSTGPASAEWTPQALREYLVTHRIAGTVATPRMDSLAKYRRLAAGDPRVQFGLRFGRHWSADDVLALMARRCGVSADPREQDGADFIDPDLTVDRLQAMAARLREVAIGRGTLLLGTGHPAGLLPIHSAVSRRLRAAGCSVLTPAAGSRGESLLDGDRHDGELRYIDRVAVVSANASLLHTHAPGAMEVMLAELRGTGQPMPDLVVADHGFAGAAGAAGLRTVGFADCNDPGLFVGEAEGLIDVSVPLDDNVLPHLYEPITAFLLQELESPA